jgi:2-hydroxychromene-2-carboxylate isomerase
VSEHGERVRFYFDPACPWTWVTSRWLLEVARQRPVHVEWRSLSLVILNEGGEVPHRYRIGRLAHRVIEALRSTGRNDDVGGLYREYGRRVHVGGRRPSTEVVREAVKAAGLDDVAGAVDDPSWDEAVRRSHEEAQEIAGPDAGSPVVFREAVGRGTFGPILSPSPVGADAVRLWDAYVTLGDLAHFYELKRPRGGEPEISPTLL